MVMITTAIAIITISTIRTAQHLHPNGKSTGRTP